MTTPDTLEFAGDGEMIDFLESALCVRIDRGAPDWQERVLRQAPQLGPFLVQAHGHGANSEGYPIIVRNPRPKVRSFFDIPSITNQLAQSIGLVLAAGGAKVLANLLKEWIESKSKATVEIRRGDVRITLVGPVNNTTLENLIAVFTRCAELPAGSAPPELTDAHDPGLRGGQS